MRLMSRQLAPRADRLEQQFRAWLSKAGYETAHSDTDVDHSRCRIALPVGERISESGPGRGRRLAKWNLPLSKINRALRRYDQLASAVLEGRFAPAREQLLLATNFLLNRPFYEVREVESQALFWAAPGGDRGF